MAIETQHLLLLPCSLEMLQIAIEGNSSIQEKLDIEVAENWTEFGLAPLQYSYDKLSSDHEENGWWTYFPIHKGENKLIGSCGYKGKPSESGVVEIGYEVAPDYRTMGFATEMANGLISNAFSNPRVTMIIAHTLSEENPSTKILRKIGFIKVGEINDPEDGLIWQWELIRPK